MHSVPVLTPLPPLFSMPPCADHPISPSTCIAGLVGVKIAGLEGGGV